MNPTPQSKIEPPPDYSQVVGTGSGKPGYTQPGYGQVAYEQIGQQSQPGYGPQRPVPGYGQVQQAGYGPHLNAPYGAAPDPHQQQQQQALMLASAGMVTPYTVPKHSPNVARSPIWGSSPQSTTCKYCHKAVTTEIVHQLGMCVMMLLFMSFGLLFCILFPCWCKSIKDVVHKCPSCKILGFCALGNHNT